MCPLTERMNSNSRSPTNVSRTNRPWFFELWYSKRILPSGARFARLLNRWGFAQLLGCLMLSILMTWPLASQLGTSLAQGTESAATVPLFTTWTVSWNADRASRGFVGYWDAPIFFPESDTLAFSEPILTSVIVAPLLWITGNRLLAHNVFLLLSLTLNGWTGFHLLRGLRIGWLAATLGGGLIVLLPMVQNELGVLQLVPLFGILGTFSCLLRLSRRRSVWRAIYLGAMFALTYLTCANYGLFASVLLLLATPWILGRRLLELQTWRALVISAAVVAVLTAPVIVAQMRVTRDHHLIRSRELVQRLSAQPLDYLVVPHRHSLEPPLARSHREVSRQQLCPGLLMYGLALLGAGCGLAMRRRRAWTCFSLTILVSALLLSLGPEFRLAGWSPYETLWTWYPGFGQVRSPFRLAVFVQLITVLLATNALDVLVRTIRKLSRRPAPNRRGLPQVLVIVAIFIPVSAALFETMPRRQHLYSPPELAQQAGWIEWLKRNTSPQTAIVCLPFPTSSHVREYQQTALWMHWSSYHQRPLVNGYSGFLPEDYLLTKRHMKDFPNEAALERLRSHGARYCVIQRSYLTRQALESHPQSDGTLSWQYGDDQADVDIYRLEPPP